MKITDSKKISTIQKEFNDSFPFLKLEFFRHKHGIYKGSSKNDIFNPEMTLKECRRKHNGGTLVLNERMKVSELEEMFSNIFGLSVQVFRKSGRSWIETTITDDWTLNRQNEEGRELSLLVE